MKLFLKAILVSSCSYVLATPTALSQIRLPRLVSNGMVLQRGTKATIWGWAKPGEQVTVRFQGKTYRTTTTSAGEWRVSLPALKAGGPYDMTLAASNSVKLQDILVGDVWLCSGQSNMETPMSRVRDKYPEEVANANNPRIRQFNVPLTYAFKGPKKDVTGGSWVPVTPQSIGEFSAVAYFFAKDINAKYQVPVGLIKDAVGGSPAEAWLSADALKQFPTYQQASEKYKDSTLVASTQQRDQAASRAWSQHLYQADQGEAPGQLKWSNPDYNASNWATTNVPGYWADQTPLGRLNGVVWFRKEVDVPASMVGKPARLELGTLINSDSTYLNGQLVGTTGYQYPPRKYDFGPDVLKPGKNTIVVRLVGGGNGGFTPDKQYRLMAGGQTLDLRGPWQYKVGAALPPAPGGTAFQYQPGGLFNGMIAPVLPYAVKGVLWYQGESNAGHPQDYQALMTSLIADWRQHLQQPNLPFLYVQLPNFMAQRQEPGESSWAQIRDIQRRLLDVPNTGMAVTLGLGEWNDIHPVTKQPVGHRLALAAEMVAYGDKKVVASGPLYQSMQTNGSQATLTFSGVGSGLVAEGGGPLQGFAVAGADHRFHWAQARVEGDKVVVWSDQVAAPTAVRYAWADNPENANLYNKEGLPASTFRTDTF